jgi:hypothetical protein
MPDTIRLKPADTEPLVLTISATGLANLDDLTSAVLYARLAGESANHVTAGALTPSPSVTLGLVFDPVDAKLGGGNAFDAPGTYQCYVLATWNDGDTTRHPGRSWLTVIVEPGYE